jgi:hypothetical protein
VQCSGNTTPLLAGEFLRVGGEHLNADVIRTGIVVLFHARSHSVPIARASVAPLQRMTPCSGSSRGPLPQYFACACGVFGRDEIRMCAVGAPCRQLQHLGPERGQNPLFDGNRLVGGVYGIQERARGGQRFAVPTRL